MGLNISRYETSFVLKQTQISKTHIMEYRDKVAFNEAEE